MSFPSLSKQDRRELPSIETLNQVGNVSMYKNGIASGQTRIAQHDQVTVFRERGSAVMIFIYKDLLDEGHFVVRVFP